AAALRQAIEQAADGWDSSAAAIAERRRKALDPQSGYEFFDRTYFPHYGKAEPSALHRYLYERLPQVLASKTGQRDAIAAPRGEAKSTKVSLIFVLWALACQRLHYPIIIMDSFEQAAEQLEAIKAELEANPRLRCDFPEMCGQGRVWRAGVIITAHGAKVEVFGAAKKIRGRRHGAHRPDLVILDDIENDERVQTPEQRDKLQRFVMAGALNLGGPDDRMHAIMVGTVLHYDSVLARMLRHPLWNRRTFRAITAWPHRMDLWDEFERRLLSGSSPAEGLQDAMQFYEARREEMDAGAEVSWPALRPLAQLMVRRAQGGHAAFASEQQNDPASGDATFASCLQFWAEPDPQWTFYGACDPSLGRAGSHGDPSAILVGGYNRADGRLCVVEARIARIAPDRIIDTIIELQRQWGCVVWGIEAVQFQEFFRTELLRRSAQAGVPVPARALVPITDKALRIESLQPHMAAGFIRVHASQTTLIEQLRHWPHAAHDDGPDALHMLWMLAASSGMAAGSQGSGGAKSARERYARQAQRMFRRLRSGEGWAI
ncbi:MAG: phage terminase large subunit, partial [Ottowia sp.]|nr:phage terminase large subunit [Ottowia sp.]